MSLSPLVEERDIAKAFGTLRRNLTGRVPSLVRRLGWHGGNDEFKLFWHKRPGLWVSLLDDLKPSHYVCLYGTEDPTEDKMLPIVCQINPPFENWTRRCAGLFAQDVVGTVYYCHTGKIGGGRPGIGKTRFLASYAGDNREEVLWPDQKKGEVIVIGPIDSKWLVHHIHRFACEVERFKSAPDLAGSGTTTASLSTSFTPEFSGKRRIRKFKHRTEANCFHGYVVDGLKCELEERGHRVAKDVPRDLYTVSKRGTRMRVLFEVKTDVSTSSTYGAVGQLLLNASDQVPPPKLVLVLPDKPKKRFARALDRLGIAVLCYHWNKERPVFENIDTLLG